MSERSGGREQSEQSGASERVNGASEQANARASGPVLTFLFLFVPDHSAPVNQKRTNFQTERSFYSRAKTQTRTWPPINRKQTIFWIQTFLQPRENIFTQKSMENDEKKDHGGDGLDRIKLRDQPVRIETIEDFQCSIYGTDAKLVFYSLNLLLRKKF